MESRFTRKRKLESSFDEPKSAKNSNNSVEDMIGIAGSYNDVVELNLNLPEINGQPMIGIQMVSDIPTLGELTMPILRGVTREMAATNAARWGYDQFAESQGVFHRNLFAASCYVIVKYGLVGMCANDPNAPISAANSIRDGRWVFVDDRHAMRHSEGMDLTAPLIREALTMVVASKVSWWTCNHHVGAAGSVGYVTKLLSSFGNGIPDETKRAAVHSAGHCAGTLRILKHIGIAGIKDTANIQEAGDVRFGLTDDFQLRTLGLPAGAGKLSIGYAILQRLIKNPVMRAVPGPMDFVALAEAYHAAMRDRVRYHIGSHYLTGHPRIVEHDMIMNTTLGRLGSFIAINYAATSLAKSPSIEATGKEGAASRYQNYEDFDAEWHRLLIEVRRAKVSENEIREIRGDGALMKNDDYELLKNRMVKIAEEGRSHVRPSVSQGPTIALPPTGPSDGF